MTPAAAHSALSLLGPGGAGALQALLLRITALWVAGHDPDAHASHFSTLPGVGAGEHTPVSPPPGSVAAVVALLEDSVARSPEAIGRVYESVIAEDTRRRAGSHYTPPDLAADVVAAVLDPLLAQRPGDAAHILSLRVCDPAMGSGVFLLAAARHLAAALRAADPGGADRAVQRVVSACLFGVDLDPMAVSLARLSLWLEAGAAGPLPVNLRVGDALVGLSAAQVRAFHWALPPSGEPGEVTALAGDLVVASFFGAPAWRARAGLRKAYRSQLGRWRAGAAHEDPRPIVAELRARGISPFHWELAFPAVFAAGGFDAVVGNPPFRNAIEERTGRSALVKDWFKSQYSPFAVGAYDYSLMFWARTTQALLGTGGRYGLVSPTSLLSSGKPWQQWMHRAWRPDALWLYPVDRFPEARIRTTAIIGGQGTPASVSVVDAEGTVRRASARWAGQPTWYAATRPTLSAPRQPVLPLSACVVVGAGCSTSVAYTLKPLVTDDEAGAGPQLVTTGALDRFVLKWGRSPIRFLKGDYTHPRWPSAGPPAVARARDRQAQPKILVGGLTAVLEAWLDEAGVSAGVVQTWVLTAPARSAAWLWALLGVVNSAAFSRLYMHRFGAAAMSGRQTTIKKRCLLEMPLPAVFADEALSPELAAVAALAEGLQRTPGLGARDRALHDAVSAMYGYDAAEAAEIYLWWCARSGTPVHEEEET